MCYDLLIVFKKLFHNFKNFNFSARPVTKICISLCFLFNLPKKIFQKEINIYFEIILKTNDNVLLLLLHSAHTKDAAAAVSADVTFVVGWLADSGFILSLGQKQTHMLAARRVPYWPDLNRAGQHNCFLKMPCWVDLNTTHWDYSMKKRPKHCYECRNQGYFPKPDQ